jgi:hypothetical protein
VQYCGGHFENGDRVKFFELYISAVLLPIVL